MFHLVISKWKNKEILFYLTHISKLLVFVVDKKERIKKNEKGKTKVK